MKLSDDLTAAASLLLELGHFRSAVAKSLGVSPRSFQGWMKRGSRENKEGVDTVYSRFFRGVREAEARAEINLIDMIRAAGERDATNLRWLAERRFADLMPPSLKREIADLKATQRELKIAIEKLTATAD